jgi:hypothetical protein
VSGAGTGRRIAFSQRCGRSRATTAAADLSHSKWTSTTVTRQRSRSRSAGARVSLPPEIDSWLRSTSATWCARTVTDSVRTPRSLTELSDPQVFGVALSRLRRANFSEDVTLGIRGGLQGCDSSSVSGSFHAPTAGGASRHASWSSTTAIRNRRSNSFLGCLADGPSARSSKRSLSAISYVLTATVLARIGAARGSSSAGRARVFQTRCRGFESRLPLGSTEAAGRADGPEIRRPRS